MVSLTEFFSAPPKKNWVRQRKRPRSAGGQRSNSGQANQRARAELGLVGLISRRRLRVMRCA